MLSCVFITKTTFYVTVKNLLCCTVLIFVNCRRHFLHVELDWYDCIEVTQYNWMCCSNTSGLYWSVTPAVPDQVTVCMGCAFITILCSLQ
jgi:hypothetical protein